MSGSCGCCPGCGWVCEDDFRHNTQASSLPGDKAHLIVTHEHDATTVFQVMELFYHFL